MTRERYCQDCGIVFDAISDDDRLCKECLLTAYRAACEEIRQLKAGTGILSDRDWT